MAAIVICKIKHEVVAEMPIKHEVKLSALLVLRQCTECFILCIVRAT